MTVVGELVETQIGHDHQPIGGNFGRNGDGPVQDPVGFACGRSRGVSPGRDAEEHDAPDPRRRGLGYRSREGIERVLRDAGHGRDRPRLGQPLGDEQRLHQIRARERRLGYQPA